MLNIFHFLGNKIYRRNRPDEETLSGVDINQAIEAVVDGIEPGIRFVSGYKKVLYPGVASSLTHISHMVDSIPGPIEISSRTFNNDPQANVYFASFPDAQKIFSQSEELHAFFYSTNLEAVDAAYALLCMDKEVKTTFGMDLQHDMLRREVLQKTLNFSDHKILSPASTENEVREGIKRCIFDGLITHALHKILDLKKQKQDLELDLGILNSRLKARKSQGGGLSRLLVDAISTKSDATIEKTIAEKNKKLRSLPASGNAYAYYLEVIEDALGHADEFVHLNISTLNLTKMGIIADEQTSQTANEIALHEILIAGVLQRVVAIVRYPRADLLPRKPFEPTL